MERNDLLPDLQIIHFDPAKLQPTKRRVRRSQVTHVEDVCHSISAMGFCEPILITGQGTIINGHIRWEAARQLRLETVPCIVIDHLTENEIRLLTIGLNRMAENGEWDVAELQLELTDLNKLNLDLELTGFSGLELDILLQEPIATAATEDEDLEAEKASTVTIPGDLWRLGQHRLLCGNALAPDSFTELMENQRARMIFTDPPYNCPIEGFVSGNGKVAHSNFAMACGEMSNSEFVEFLRQPLEYCRQFSEPASVIFACMDWRQSHNLVLAAEAAKLRLIQMCVWDKGVGGMGSLYRNAFEQVHVYCDGPTPAVNNIMLC